MKIIQKREFSELSDVRLIKRGNQILSDLFSKGTHSIRQLCSDASSAKGCYRFLQNESVTEEDILSNMTSNCIEGCKGRYLVCIQDTTDINLSGHSNRINKDGYLGTTNAKNDKGLGFLLHPCLVLDAQNGIPYGYADVKIWNRPLSFSSKHQRQYNKLPIEQKESYKWIEVSKNTQERLREHIPGMVIVQDREGDIYEQFATIPDQQTDLLIRAYSNRTLADKTKLFDGLQTQKAQGQYKVAIAAKNGRKKRIAQMEIRYKSVILPRTQGSSKDIAPTVELYLIEAKEVCYKGKDAIHWRLLTTIPVDNVEIAKMCIEWYSWRWTIEEVFRILKKEGYNIEASELEYASSVRKLSLMILEVVIKIFLMRIAYSEPEMDIHASTCFTEDEQELLEEQIKHLEGSTKKQLNPYGQQQDLKRYVWVIARLGGWKGYESKRRPGITTLWIGMQHFKSAYQGWCIHRNMSTR